MGDRCDQDGEREFKRVDDLIKVASVEKDTETGTVNGEKEWRGEGEMTTIRHFRELEVYQLAMDLANEDF